MLNEMIKNSSSEIWIGAALGAVVTGHLGFLIIVFIVFYGYQDSRNIAFDSPKLSDPDVNVKITPLERGY